MGAPAQRILWMRFTQNNFLNIQAELIRKTSIILNTHHLYLTNYYAFGNHMKYGCTQAPLFCGNVTRDAILHIFIYCLI